jgi:hypothetical protein
MCWSGQASATLAVVGAVATIYFWKKGEAKALWISLLYFTVMEIIQTYTYTVINRCYDPRNNIITTLAYIHIAFQPFFFNAIALHFIPEHRRKKIQKYVYFLCALATVALIIRIMPLQWERFCYEVRYYVPFMKHLLYQVPFCGELTCSTSGGWHMEWAIKAGHNWYLDRVYFMSVFLLPLFYGSWRATMYGAIMGPGITLLTTDTANEFAAVWCLYSVALVLLMILPPARKLLYVRSYYGSGWFGYKDVAAVQSASEKV